MAIHLLSAKSRGLLGCFTGSGFQLDVRCRWLFRDCNPSTECESGIGELPDKTLITVYRPEDMLMLYFRHPEMPGHPDADDLRYLREHRHLIPALTKGCQEHNFRRPLVAKDRQ